MNTSNENFKKSRHGIMMYCEKGNIKQYCNKTQAAAKCIKLQSIGVETYVSFEHPFTLIQK